MGKVFPAAALILLTAAGGDGRSPARIGDDDCRRAAHVLNRLAFGPRPGEVEHVLSIGIRRWIEEQLHPETIPDPVADDAISSLPTLSMADAELIEKFEKPTREARRFVEKEFGKPGERGEEAEKVSRRMLDELVSPASRPQRVLDELTRARLVRAAVSERQLQEVLVDFWMNHFNVFAGKDLDRAFVTSFERDVIRPHLWGCFRNLLLATAKSPAMLVYLDNAQSAAEPDHRRQPPSAAGKPGGAGLNENYARELLELHTLGVDGGYTQLDVTELARVLTGWSTAPPEEGGGFLFRAPLHDVCAKTVLGVGIPAGGGLAEGEDVIARLARHPSTARRIATLLCQRLVADEPPPGLVRRAADRFLATDGDLRETVRTIVESPEFFDTRFERGKVKSPFEYAVSAVRALGAQTDGGPALSRAVAGMGEPLYLCAPPTGYSQTSGAWMNTGALIARWNFAIALAGNRIAGTPVDLVRLVPPSARTDSRRVAEALEAALLGNRLSESTRQRIDECVLQSDVPGGAPGRTALVAAAILGSPEFQKR